MRSYRHFLIVSLAILGALSSCSDRTSISGVVQDAPLQDIVIGADTVRTAADGSFKYAVQLKKGQPEFYYITRGGVRLASLLVESGEKVVVKTDTLGLQCSIEGSEGSALMNEQDVKFQEFVDNFVSAGSELEMKKLYVDYYRSCLSFVMRNQRSLSVVPVLTRHIAPQAPVFSQSTDAMIFRSTADTLKTVYPDSKYVKALSEEASRRENQLKLELALANAKEAGFPNLMLPGMTGENISLAGVDAKVIILHFWDATSAEQKMVNIDALLPLYDEFHSKGLEIYSVCICANKPLWAQIVRDQKLPWVNVCDGLGTASRSLGTYNVTELPTTILIADGQIVTDRIMNEDKLKEFLRKKLN